MNLSSVEAQYDSLLKLISDLETSLDELEDKDGVDGFNLRTSLYHYRIEAGDCADLISRKYDELRLEGGV